MSAHMFERWRVSAAKPTKNRGIDILSEDGTTLIASVPIRRYVDPTFSNAYARLISAAPDMLEALRKARPLIAEEWAGISGGDGNHVLREIDAALAKAGAV